MAQRNSDGHVRVYAALEVAEDWAERAGIDFARPTEVLAALLKVFTDWSPRVLPMLTASEDEFARRPLYGFPPGQSWVTTPGVTLIGDAAHVMPPFSGAGSTWRCSTPSNWPAA